MTTTNDQQQAENSPHETNGTAQEATFAQREDKAEAMPTTDLDYLTDGKQKYEWKSKYPPDAKIEIRMETAYLCLVLLLSHMIIFLTWNGWICSKLAAAPLDSVTLRKYAYFASGGLLGGIVFGLKFFYHAVAKGLWHQDRRIWRLMSPYLSMSIGLVVGAMIDASFISTAKPISGAAFVSIGFLAGYFADRAVAKMGEVASVVFGRSVAPRD